MRKILSVFVLSACFQVFFSQSAPADDFYGLNPAPGSAWTPPCETCRGFYWGEPEPLPSQKEEEKKKESKKERRDDFELPVVNVPPPLRERFSDRDLMKLHPDQLQFLVTAYMKKAVQDPTPDNVGDYYHIQNVTRLKSDAYANVAGYVVQTDAKLDLNRDYPLAAPARDASNGMKLEEIAQTIRDAQGDFALVLFRAQGCRYCEEQDKINRLFTASFGWVIRDVDVNEHPDLAKQFSVDVTPAMILIYRNGQPGKDYMPVSIGVVAADDLALRLYRSIRFLTGKITPEQFSLMEFQRGGSLDPSAIQGGEK